MGTKKNGHFGKKFRAPGGSYTQIRERGFAAQAPLTGPPPLAAPSRLPLRPACRSVLAHAPREKVSLASSSHPPTSGPHFLPELKKYPSSQYTNLDLEVPSKRQC
jgi:hypothetical protein